MASRRARPLPQRLPNSPIGRYWALTRYPLNCLVFIAPLMLVYEISVAVMGTDLLARNQLQQFLDQLGATASHLSAALVAVVLVIWHIGTRHRWRVNGQVVCLMCLESAVLALPLLGIGLLSQRLGLAAYATEALPGHRLAHDLLAGVGGGIYEEFLFRLVGLNLFTFILVDVVDLPKEIGYLLAIVACAALFALYHFPREQAVDWPRFAFYLLAGCYLATVYVFRGFGVAVGAHVCYNLIISLLKG